MASQTKAPSNPKAQPTAARTCSCSPTTHPGSFRCSFHRNNVIRPGQRAGGESISRRVSCRQHWELAMMPKANSLKAFLLQMIRPSSHDLQRRRNFHPKPTRFWLMNHHSNPNGLTVS